MGKNKKKASQVMGLKDANFLYSFKNGNAVTKASAFVFGLGNFLHGQIVRGLLLLAVEIAYIAYMISFGISSIGGMITLGTVEQGKVWDEAQQIYVYTKGDNSMLLLLYGVITIFLTLAVILFATISVRSAYATQWKLAHDEKLPNIKEDIKSLTHENLHVLLLSGPCIGVIIFTILPLVFTILIAFTSYDSKHQPPGNLFDWVGLENFKNMFSSTGALASTFWPVLQWTLIWAVFATFSSYILGMILAIVINRKGTRFKGFWRFIFVLSIAIPQFVSLLSMKTIFNANGPVNVLLRNFGIIGATDSVPFLTDPFLAKVTIICINIWIGVPYTMLTMTGILQSIPEDLYEAARVDGANPVVMFFKITLPYMLFVTTPNLITSFTGNINNFNVIYLLSGGGPDKLEYYYAGQTDLLVTWLYKLTITQKDYNLGAVIGILVFVILATLSLVTYRHSGSYKNEEAFQ